MKLEMGLTPQPNSQPSNFTELGRAECPKCKDIIAPIVLFNGRICLESMDGFFVFFGFKRCKRCGRVFEWRGQDHKVAEFQDGYAISD